MRFEVLNWEPLNKKKGLKAQRIGANDTAREKPVCWSGRKLVWSRTQEAYRRYWCVLIEAEASASPNRLVVVHAAGAAKAHVCPQPAASRDVWRDFFFAGRCGGERDKYLSKFDYILIF